MPFRVRMQAPALHLPHVPLPRGRYRITTERDIPVTMPDGVTLLADRFVPVGVRRPPTILVRSPYGRRGLTAVLNGMPFAHFGFQVVVQSVRGTFGSGGEFDPLGSEQEDGLATVRWLKEQPWFGGTFATYGASYLGYSAWAIAAQAGPELKAMAAQITASTFRDATYIGGGFALESVLSWTDLTTRAEQRLGLVSSGLLSKRRAVRAAFSGRPLVELDLLATGAKTRFFQDLLANADATSEVGTDYWRKRDFSATVCDVEAPVTLLGGWYDAFLPWQLRDYAALRSAGRRPHLTIGPWWHADYRHVLAATRESLDWFRAHLMGDFSRIRSAPVRVYVTGAGRWRDLSDWPPPGVRAERWHLHPGGGLGPDGPRPSEPDTYRFDPERPTPSLGGPTLLGSSKPVDQRPIERRDDVLVFTSPALETGFEAVGPVSAELYVRSSRPHTDFIVRLCDVAPDGTSRNLAEGGRRLFPGDQPADADGIRRVSIDLWPVGHRFRRGHRVRVHVTSGAFPKVAGNPGTGEPLHAVTTMVAAEQEIFHDPDHRSAIVLPVLPRESAGTDAPLDSAQVPPQGSPDGSPLDHSG